MSTAMKKSAPAGGNRFAALFSASTGSAPAPAEQSQQRNAFPMSDRRHPRKDLRSDTAAAAPTAESRKAPPMPSAFSKTRREPREEGPNPFNRQRTAPAPVAQAQHEGEQRPNPFGSKRRDDAESEQRPNAFARQQGRQDDTPSAFGSRRGRGEQPTRERNMIAPPRPRTPTPPPKLEDEEAFPDLGASISAPKKTAAPAKQYVMDLSEEAMMKKAQEKAAEDARKAKIPKFGSSAKKAEEPAAPTAPAPAPAPADDFPALGGAPAPAAPVKMSWAQLAKKEPVVVQKKEEPANIMKIDLNAPIEFNTKRWSTTDYDTEATYNQEYGALERNSEPYEDGWGGSGGDQESYDDGGAW